MRIDFFEEFPTPENMRKIELLEFPSTIYVAAHSYSQFVDITSQQDTPTHLNWAYWPLLERSYWLSPFAHPNEVEGLLKDLQQRNSTQRLPILLDLELPLLVPRLFWQNFLFFRQNKRKIRALFEQSQDLNVSIATAEYPLFDRLFEKSLGWLGLSYPLEQFPHDKIVMYYTSIIPSFAQPAMRYFLLRKYRRYKDNLKIGLGTIATGIFGNEPLLSPEELHNDLLFLSKHGIKHVVLFRLGGLNDDYLEVIKRHLGAPDT